MKRLVFVCVMSLALAVAAGAAMKQGKGMGGKMGQGNQPMMCQQMMGLSQAQMADMQKMKAAFAVDTAALRTELQAKQQDMMKLWSAQDVDLAQIKANAADMDQVKAQIRDKAIDLHYAIVTQVLTPDQRAKCVQACQSGQCGMGGGMGMGMCPMGGGMGMGAGCGMGAGMGTGAGMGAGMGPKGGCGMGMGPNGAGCPLTK